MDILLYQPAIFSEEDKVYFNGQLVLDQDKSSEAYSRIVSIFKNVKNTYPYTAKINGLYVIRGLFDAIDEKGRTMTFIFASDSDDYSDQVLNVTQSIGYPISKSTLKCINDFKHNRKLKQSIFISLITILVSTLLIYLLCK